MTTRTNQRRSDSRLHWAIVLGENDDLVSEGMTLCGIRRASVRCQTARMWQMRHALHSSADTCEDCQAFFNKWEGAFAKEERRSGYIAGLMAEHGLLP